MVLLAVFVLAPGDLIAPGHAAGRRFGMKPVQQWLKAGDVVEMGIEGLGGGGGGKGRRSWRLRCDVIAGRERRGRLTAHYPRRICSGGLAEKGPAQAGPS